jgi:hypothetical protein
MITYEPHNPLKYKRLVITKEAGPAFFHFMVKFGVFHISLSRSGCQIQGSNATTKSYNAGVCENLQSN